MAVSAFLVANACKGLCCLQIRLQNFQIEMRINSPLKAVVCMHLHRDADPEVCQMQQRVAAYEYARQAAEMPFPGGVRASPLCHPLIGQPGGSMRAHWELIETLLSLVPQLDCNIAPVLSHIT